MPPSTASAKNSPTTALVGPEMDAKDMDDIHTHTSESVCSSSGTETETTTTNSLHVATLHASLATTPTLAAATALSHCSRSPTSPMPCGLPADSLSAIAAATATNSKTIQATRTASAAAAASASLASSPTRPPPSPSTAVEKRRTPAPPPPIDFCGSLRHPAQHMSSVVAPLPASLRESTRSDSVRCPASDAGLLSPLSTQPAASLAASPTGAAVVMTPSVLHPYSEPFHPQERSISGSAARIGLSAGAGVEGALSLRPPLSPSSTPHHDYVSSSVDYIAMDRHVSSAAGGNGGDDLLLFGGATRGGGGANGLPRLINSPGQGGAAYGGGNGLSYDPHWQDTGAGAYGYSHFFTQLPSAMEAVEGDSLRDGFYPYVPRSSNGGGGNGSGGSMTQPRSVSGVHDGANSNSLQPSMPLVGLDCPSGGAAAAPWSSSSPSQPMAVDLRLPTYADPQLSYFHDPPPPLRPAPMPDYDYHESTDPYDDGGFREQEMQFRAYVPQDVQCVEHLEDLNYVCHAILEEAAARERQYQRRCRARQYLAEDTFEEDELEGKMVIALDLEGRSLGRSGSICIITLATYSTVYIIDMVLLGAQALGEGSSLKAVLESDTITKLMFDCRADCDALFFLYQVRLRSVCDLQVSSCFALFPLARHLPGMKDVFRALGLFADEDTDIKDAGRHLFNPESGGSFDRWEERPLTALLLQYCAVDVKYFFLAKIMLWDHIDEGYCLGEARLASVCAGNFVGCSKGNSLRDFEVR